MLTLNNLKSPKGAHRNVKRIGRGQGSGQGTQAGKGHKGQKARSGGGVRTGFEGGNMPLYMRLPKRGTFTNARFKKEFAVINLSDLDANYENGAEVTKENLIEKGLVRGRKRNYPVKVLSTEIELKKSLNFSGEMKFSKVAKEMILKAGGRVD